jgi:hypothetical protein
MTTTTYSNGFANLVGQTLGSLKVLQIERRVPNIAWQARCITCGSSGVYTHQQLTTNPICRNLGCGRSVPPPSPTLGRTVNIPTAIRSSDSVDARAFIQQRQAQTVIAPITSQTLASADPDTIARFIDFHKGKK